MKSEFSGSTDSESDDDDNDADADDDEADADDESGATAVSLFAIRVPRADRDARDTSTGLRDALVYSSLAGSELRRVKSDESFEGTDGSLE